MTQISNQPTTLHNTILTCTVSSSNILRNNVTIELRFIQEGDNSNKQLYTYYRSSETSRNTQVESSKHWGWLNEHRETRSWKEQWPSKVANNVYHYIHNNKPPIIFIYCRNVQYFSRHCISKSSCNNRHICKQFHPYIMNTSI
jgi:hypothetical protein